MTASVAAASASAARVLEEAARLDLPLEPDAVVAHGLRSVGVAARTRAEPAAGGVLVIVGDGSAAIVAGEDAVARGEPVIVLAPGAEITGRLGLGIAAPGTAGPHELAVAGGGRRLRTLFPVCRFLAPGALPLLDDDGDAAAGVWVAQGAAGWLVLGTQLARDLVRYRQGDPRAAVERHTGSVWGEETLVNERPNYLYWPLRGGEPPARRHVDEWLYTLRTWLSEHAAVCAAPVLPDGAAAALVLTGDDDQAYLEKYAAQVEAIGDTPISYFLHPLTRHGRDSLAALARGRRLDLGLHPDALDDPHAYRERYAEQARWYRALAGEAPLSVRNHGFLNDGYWGHLPDWLAEGCRFSLNVPGLDGEVVTASLLPFRVQQRGVLSDHWSALTLFGDGMRFVKGVSDEQAAAAIHDRARAVCDSAMPGVIVLNLHPQNVDECRAMHAAVRDLARGRLVAWTVRECLDWFRRADGCEAPSASAPVLGATRGARHGAGWRRWLGGRG